MSVWGPTPGPHWPKAVSIRGATPGPPAGLTASVIPSLGPWPCLSGGGPRAPRWPDGLRDSVTGALALRVRAGTVRNMDDAAGGAAGYLN